MNPYQQGFTEKCAQSGIDPQLLINMLPLALAAGYGGKTGNDVADAAGSGGLGRVARVAGGAGAALVGAQQGSVLGGQLGQTLGRLAGQNLSQDPRTAAMIEHALGTVGRVGGMAAGAHFAPRVINGVNPV